MPLSFNYLKIPKCFIGWNASLAKNSILNAENVLLILQMIGTEINLTITKTYLQ